MSPHDSPELRRRFSLLSAGQSPRFHCPTPCRHQFLTRRSTRIDEEQEVALTAEHTLLSNSQVLWSSQIILMPAISSHRFELAKSPYMHTPLVFGLCVIATQWPRPTSALLFPAYVVHTLHMNNGLARASLFST